VSDIPNYELHQRRKRLLRKQRGVNILLSQVMEMQARRKKKGNDVKYLSQFHQYCDSICEVICFYVKKFLNEKIKNKKLEFRTNMEGDFVPFSPLRK